MTANTSPIFTGTPSIQWGTTDDNSAATVGPMLTANTTTNGTPGSGSLTTVFTAGANGSYVQRLIAHPVSTNIATVLRIFINNGSSASTPANNIMYQELSLPATTANAAGALQGVELGLNFALPAGYVLNCTLGTTVAGGYYVSVVGGNY
jgi:hypothetical protein